MAGDPAPELEMLVESVRVHMRTGRHVLLLKEVGAGRILPVWIGSWEAQAIAMRLQGISAERPLTHDLFVATLAALGVRIDRVVIATLADETFHARLELVTADSRHEVDARPSDAIALAVRLDCPIYASAQVLDQAAALPDDDEGDDEEDEEGAAAREEARGVRRSRLAAGSLEATGESLDPTKLDIFREFVNSLDLGGRRSPQRRGQLVRLAAAQDRRAPASCAASVRPQPQPQHPEVLHGTPDDGLAGRPSASPRCARSAERRPRRWTCPAP